MSELVFVLNSETRSVSAKADTPLVEILRDQLFATDTKLACGIGRCGACTVLVDDRLMNACLVMAWQVAGRHVVTSRGLDDLPDAQIIRDALAAESAFQCGYCAPGFTMAIFALLRGSHHVSETQIRAALEGNTCRCTGYHSIVRGALNAANRLAEAQRSLD
ncbi:MAG: 2Fe-2S iron-sulfur cluster-binding protein [Pseudomonadota bacterium]